MVCMRDDAEIFDAHADGVEVDNFLIVLSAGFPTIDNPAELTINVLVLEEALVIHERDRADHTVLDALPGIAYDLTGLTHAVVCLPTRSSSASSITTAWTKNKPYSVLLS